MANRESVRSALLSRGIFVVIGRNHVKDAEDVAELVAIIHNEGYIPEITNRIDSGILREAMGILAPSRAKPGFYIGIGSILNPGQLEEALKLGADMVVSPASGTGGYAEPFEFVRTAHANGVFAIPAAFSPHEISYYLDREGDRPDAVKIFPALNHGPKGIAAILDPFRQPQHEGFIFVPTGGVDRANAADYREAVAGKGFNVALGMSDPLRDLKKDSDDFIASATESLTAFTLAYQGVNRLS